MKYAQEVAEVENKYALEKEEFQRGIDEEKRNMTVAHELEMKQGQEQYELDKTKYSNQVAELQLNHDLSEAKADQEHER